ncbi:hypothetical protein B0T16DRAFT_395504 [Cercophora newfieldiana]|uniref:Uncharacterized protein n=1 Tax=Cercophora newfieldiana TaxID=92897 RepID=A0AA39XUF0_9PEZI|nr:hypothetical protein B0T16DRAFT_395504 [Cercophora newfieldiana]
MSNYSISDVSDVSDVGDVGYMTVSEMSDNEPTSFTGLGLGQGPQPSTISHRMTLLKARRAHLRAVAAERAERKAEAARGVKSHDAQTKDENPEESAPAVFSSPSSDSGSSVEEFTHGISPRPCKLVRQGAIHVSDRITTPGGVVFQDPIWITRSGSVDITEMSPLSSRSSSISEPISPTGGPPFIGPTATPLAPLKDDRLTLPSQRARLEDMRAGNQVPFSWPPKRRRGSITPVPEQETSEHSEEDRE